ncbi:hypothetical protein NE237_012456 [Protea cynaroides]|uniref:Uncharacterized protein n=1 Tax=Protea cynaroides TaxID=273540 RepID=A0A9Q0GZU4_9MAGN|nr:hypothetical protein NE237_012456 [Protea cynaroides]
MSGFRVLLEEEISCCCCLRPMRFYGTSGDHQELAQPQALDRRWNTREFGVMAYRLLLVVWVLSLSVLFFFFIHTPVSLSLPLTSDPLLWIKLAALPYTVSTQGISLLEPY